jgi:outer membrane lipoprotein-sorting protein
MFLVVAALLCVAVIPQVGLCSTDADAAETLARVDGAAIRSDDVTTTLEIAVHDGKGNEAQRLLRVWQKGDDRRLVKFLEPARVAGVGLLALDGDTIHLYLPTYERARRVSGKGRGDAFMGTNFSVDELTRMKFSDEYRPSLLTGDDAHLRLRLDPLEPGDHTHAYVEMWVRREDDLFDRLDYFDERGELSRQLTLHDVRPEGDHPVAHRIEIEDLRSGRRTVATVRDVTFDTGLEDDLFTTRNLMRIPTTE